ncbi:hypothetical protein GCM10023238_01710 [Streptomyces heliomycini]
MPGLAANIDTVVVTVIAGYPAEARQDRTHARPGLGERRPAVVVLTKADQCADAQLAAAEVSELAPGTDVLVTSAVTVLGLDTLTAVLNGPSCCWAPPARASPLWATAAGRGAGWRPPLCVTWNARGGTPPHGGS